MFSLKYSALYASNKTLHIYLLILAQITNTIFDNLQREKITYPYFGTNYKNIIFGSALVNKF